MGAEDLRRGGSRCRGRVDCSCHESCLLQSRLLYWRLLYWLWRPAACDDWGQHPRAAAAKQRSKHQTTLETLTRKHMNHSHPSNWMAWSISSERDRDRDSFQVSPCRGQLRASGGRARSSCPWPLFFFFHQPPLFFQKRNMWVSQQESCSATETF